MDFWRSVIRRQFDAALDMLGNAIDACPDSVWFSSGRHTFWYLAFHALFWTDFYLFGEDRLRFHPPPPFSLTEFEEGILPERAYSKDELLAYVKHCRKRLNAVVAAMTESWAANSCPLPYREMSNGELLLYNLRHVQHHAAQLNMLLRQKTDSAPAWVSKGSQNTDT